MSAKITDLPAAAAILTTTLFESVDPAGTNVSEKLTFQKVLDYLNANSVSLGGGNFVIDAAGNLTMQQSSFSTNGSAVFSNGDAVIDAGGAITGSSLSAANGFTGSVQVLSQLPTTFSTMTFVGGICTSVTTP